MGDPDRSSVEMNLILILHVIEKRLHPQVLPGLEYLENVVQIVFVVPQFASDLKFSVYHEVDPVLDLENVFRSYLVNIYRLITIFSTPCKIF